MNKLLLAFAIITLGLSAASVSAQTPGYFEQISGRWQGRLEYQDYTSNKRVTMKTFITVTPAADGKSASFATVYDDFGKIYRSNDTAKFDLDAMKYIDGGTEYAVESIELGRIVLIGKTQDGNTTEPTRKTITYTADTLTILKETRNPWQFRNAYTLRRIKETNEPDVILTRDELSQDFNVLKKTLVELHPGIYRYNTPQQLEMAFANFEKTLSEPMSERQFFIKTAQFVSLLKCGHTYANPFNQNEKLRQRLFGGRTYLPFYFKVVDRRFIITANASSKSLAVGSEITKINGIAVKEIIEKLLTVTRADGNSTLEHRLDSIGLVRADAESYALFDWYFPLFFPIKDEVFNLEAIDFATKKPTTFSVTTMSKDERTVEMERILGPRPTYDDGWKFEIRDGSLGYLKIENSITWRLKTIKFEQFLADAFARLRNEKIANLIIDLRGNGGGSMDIGFQLSRHLATKPLPPYAESRRLVRNIAALPELAQYLTTYSDDLMAGLKNGIPQTNYRKVDDRYFEIIGRPSYGAVTPHANNFLGKTYIIADSSNASATFQFLDYAQQNRLATIVGQTTGGNKQGINGGNYFFLSLPNSKIEIDVPVFFQAPLAPRNDEGIIPDNKVTRQPNDIGNKVDREAEAIKTLIRDSVKEN